VPLKARVAKSQGKARYVIHPRHGQRNYLSYRFTSSGTSAGL